MCRKAIIISRGFHPPWNMGEVVLTKNFAKILMRIYDEVSIFSTIDKKRGAYDLLEVKQHFDVKYYNNEDMLKIAVLNELRNTSIDVHFINASTIKFINVIRKARRVYLYHFAYNIENLISVALRSYGALPLTYLGITSILTTSPKAYESNSKLFRKQYHYIPSPIEPPTVAYNCQGYKANHEVNLLYLGHASYLRFPYDVVFKVLSKLNKENSYKVKLKMFIPRQRYTDYEAFTSSCGKVLRRLGLEEFVEIHARDLSEHEKYEVISKSDILIYPALTNAAIDPPVTVLEGMLLGKCVVATSVQSIPLVLRRNRGVIIERRKLLSELYHAIKILVSNPQLIEKYGMNARLWVSKIHNIRSVGDRIREILSKE